ncbi:MAG: hypothetical protein J7L30_00165 [Methanophagales archaeon]|nr:hypothetical protein [Methanophagales archaeon]
MEGREECEESKLPLSTAKRCRAANVLGTKATLRGSCGCGLSRTLSVGMLCCGDHVILRQV